MRDSPYPRLDPRVRRLPAGHHRLPSDWAICGPRFPTARRGRRRCSPWGHPYVRNRSTSSEESAPMRLEELILRIPGDEFQVRFHEHLTVLSGIGLLERQALADSVMGALTGGAENAVVTLRDHTGRPIEIVCRGG